MAGVLQSQQANFGRLATGRRSWSATLGLIACLALSGQLQAGEPLLSRRAPLIDAAARAEVDGYRRLDQVFQRAEILPDVFDPEVYSLGATPVDLRGMLLNFVLWLQGAEASHLEMIESLPARLADVATDEPYRTELIERFRNTTPERYRWVQAFYQEELTAAETRLAVLELVASDGVRPSRDGFTFRSETDAESYRKLVASMNQSFAQQGARISSIDHA